MMIYLCYQKEILELRGKLGNQKLSEWINPIYATLTIAQLCNSRYNWEILGVKEV